MTQCVILYPVCLSSLFPCPLLLTIFLISLGYFINWSLIVHDQPPTNKRWSGDMEFQNKFFFFMANLWWIHGEWSASQVLRPEGQLEIHPCSWTSISPSHVLPHWIERIGTEVRGLRPSVSYLLFVSLVFASTASSNFLDVSHSWINPWQVMCFAPQLLNPEGRLRVPAVRQ